MIRRILVFPLRILRAFFMAVGVIVFILVGTLDFFIQKKGSIPPIRYSRGGKVVDLDGFRTDKTRGEP